MCIELAGFDWRRPATIHQELGMDSEYARCSRSRPTPQMSVRAIRCNCLGCFVFLDDLAHTRSDGEESGEGSKLWDQTN